MGSVALGIASIAATAIATGVSVYSASEQADNANRLAAYNAAVQRNNAALQYAAAEQQNAAQRQIINAQVASQQSQAKAIEQQAQAVDMQSREDIRRTREQKMRMLSSQRAAYAGAGVVMEGTPLAVLSETAGFFEMDVADKLYQSELDMRALHDRAAMTRYGADLDKWQSHLLDIDNFSNTTALKMANRGADLTRLEGAAKSQGLRTQGYATLLSSASDMAWKGYKGL